MLGGPEAVDFGHMDQTPIVGSGKRPVEPDPKEAPRDRKRAASAAFSHAVRQPILEKVCKVIR